MKENKLLLICVLIFSLAIITGSVWIGNSIRNANKDTNGNQSLYSLTNNKGLITEKETAEYLSLSQDKFKSLVSYNESQMDKLKGYDTYKFIPFVEIDGVKYFNKEQLDKWIEYNVMHGREINTN